VRDGGAAEKAEKKDAREEAKRARPRLDTTRWFKKGTRSRDRTDTTSTRTTSGGRLRRRRIARPDSEAAIFSAATVFFFPRRG